MSYENPDFYPEEIERIRKAWLENLAVQVVLSENIMCW